MSSFTFAPEDTTEEDGESYEQTEQELGRPDSLETQDFKLSQNNSTAVKSFGCK